MWTLLRSFCIFRVFDKIYAPYLEQVGIIQELYTLYDDEFDSDGRPNREAASKRCVFINPDGEHYRPFVRELLPIDEIMELLYF